MRKHKGYEDYKDSGVEWIGEVPRYWSMVPVKRRFDVQLGKMLQNHPESEADVSTPYIKALYVLWGKVDTSGLPEMWASPADVRQYGVKKGDLLVCEGGEAGRAGIIVSVPSLCIIQNAVHRVRGNGADVRFLLYVLHAVSSGGWFDVLCNKATIAHFTRKKLAELQVPLPATIDEQHTIAAFLDHKTSEIDALITDKEKLIELLKEQRQAIITEAVTKGLNPDVKMKDSGVEWIGEVPEHWTVNKLKRVANIVTGNTPPKEEEENYENGLIPWVKPDNIHDDFTISDTKEKLSKIGLKKARLIPKESALVCCIGSVGKLGINKFACTTNQQINAVIFDRPTNFNHCFGLYILCSMKQEFEKQSNKVVVSILNKTQQGNIFVTVPPINEQYAIAAFLDQKTSEIDALITKEKTQIEKLKSYRQSLIYEAVTGKIDVRNWSDKPLERSDAVANA